ncbi:MAG TPA: aspartyl protease family protein [Rhizomicrobium sp.]|nr:aspartyl protease family protein [Rhizomicrobium sp.]
MKRVVCAAFAAFFMTSAACAAAEADMGQAEKLFEQGQFDRASAIYQTVPKGTKFYETALRQLGTIALYKNHLGEAEAMLTNARALNPVDELAVSHLAETYVRAGKFSDMAELLRQLGRTDRAAEFALFGKSQPFRIVGKPGTATIPFQWTDPLPVVRAHVNDLDGLFLIDTGAPEMILDPEFARDAHVPMTSPAGPPGAGTTVFGRVAKVILPGVEVDDVPAMMMDTRALMAFSRRKRLAGVIGTEFLSHFRFTLDYPHDRLILEPHDSPLRTGASIAQIPLWFIGDHFLLAHGRVDKAPDQLFLIDTGVVYAFAAPESTLRDAGIPVPPPKGVQRGAIAPSAPFPIKELTVGGLEEKNLTGLYGPFPPPLEKGLGVHVGGLVAHAFFQPYAVTFDFDRGTITVQK